MVVFVFLNFAKAFDKVPQQRLLLKLGRLSIDNILLSPHSLFTTQIHGNYLKSLDPPEPWRLYMYVCAIFRLFLHTVWTQSLSILSRFTVVYLLLDSSKRFSLWTVTVFNFLPRDAMLERYMLSSRVSSFLTPKITSKFRRGHPNEAPIEVGYNQIGDFRPISRDISKNGKK